jgi:hypothetical protein
VLNDDVALEGYRTVPNITRILEHEIGHGIGLGHTDAGQDNIMYFACCPPAIPVPPAIGPDDLAGLVFIYPMPAPPTCTYTIGPPSSLFSSASGDSLYFTVETSLPTCAWTAVPNAPWIYLTGGESGTGNGTITLLVGPNLANPAERSAAIAIGSASATVTQAGDVDLNGDGLYENWVNFFRLDVPRQAAAGRPPAIPDGDGVSNLASRPPARTRVARSAATSPKVRQRVLRYRAGALHPAVVQCAHVSCCACSRKAAASAPGRSLVGGCSAPTVERRVFESLTTAPFSTLIESDRPIVAIGRCAGTPPATAPTRRRRSRRRRPPGTSPRDRRPGTSRCSILLQNPGDVAASASVRFLRPAPQAPITKTYSIAPHARLTIPVDAIPELASTDVSGVVTATQPIVVERAMYLSVRVSPSRLVHASAGVTAPATSWFLAEGATGSFFDLFVLIENPTVQTAVVRVDYLLPGGGTLSKPYAVGPQSRFTIWVDDEQLPAGSGVRPLASTAVAMRVTSTNAVPIIVERSMWWPQPNWYEAHNAPGTTVTGTKWALAEGFVGGPKQAETYLLVANTAATAGVARVTLYFENGSGATRDVPLPPESRTSLAISSVFPEAAGKRFGTVIQSVGAAPVPIVVERAMYESPGGVTWAAGTDVVATRVTP